MDVRERINEKPRLMAGIVIVVIVAVVTVVLWRGHGAGQSGGAGSPGKAWFTDDDGKTWFADDANKIPPFEHNGELAVRAQVYRFGGKTFVNHMERYAPAAKKRLEEMSTAKTIDIGPGAMSAAVSGLEVKRPGQSAWVKESSPQGAAIMRPHCDKPDRAEPVPAS